MIGQLRDEMQATTTPQPNTAPKPTAEIKTSEEVKSTSSDAPSTASDEQAGTYEEQLQNICDGNDLVWFTTQHNECILVDYPTLIQYIDKDTHKIPPYTIEYPSFVLDVNQFGYANTAVVKYSGGEVKESYEDLVQVFGEITKTYDQPTLSKSEATIFAKGKLATMLRDFAMETQATVLYTGKIIPGNWIKITNPITRNEEIYYVSGVNVSHSPGSTLKSSLTLLYSPKNPEVTEIPEITGPAATTDGSGVINPSTIQSINEIAQTLNSPYEVCRWVKENLKYEFYWDSQYTTAQTLERRTANCADGSDVVVDLAKAKGYQAEIQKGQICQGIGHLNAVFTINGQRKVCDWCCPDLDQMCGNG